MIMVRDLSNERRMASWLEWIQDRLLNPTRHVVSIALDRYWNNLTLARPTYSVLLPGQLCGAESMAVDTLTSQ